MGRLQRWLSTVQGRRGARRTAHLDRLQRRRHGGQQPAAERSPPRRPTSRGSAAAWAAARDAALAGMIAVSIRAGVDQHGQATPVSEISAGREVQPQDRGRSGGCGPAQSRRYSPARLKRCSLRGASEPACRRKGGRATCAGRAEHEGHVRAVAQQQNVSARLSAPLGRANVVGGCAHTSGGRNATAQTPAHGVTREDGSI